MHYLVCSSSCWVFSSLNLIHCLVECLINRYGCEPPLLLLELSPLFKLSEISVNLLIRLSPLKLIKKLKIVTLILKIKLIWNFIS